MKPLLVLHHLLHRVLLWNAEIQTDNAARCVIEAETEIQRAAQLLAHNTRLLNDARQKATLSGYAIDKAERVRFLGI